MGPETAALETLIRALAFYWKVRMISIPGDIRRPDKFYHCFIVWKYNTDFIASSLKPLHDPRKQKLVKQYWREADTPLYINMGAPGRRGLSFEEKPDAWFTSRATQVIRSVFLKSFSRFGTSGDIEEGLSFPLRIFLT